MARPQAHLHSDGPLRRSVSKRTGHQRRGLHVADSLVEAAQADVRNLGGPELPQVRRRIARTCDAHAVDYEVQRAALPTQGMDQETVIIRSSGRRRPAIPHLEPEHNRPVPMLPSNNELRGHGSSVDLPFEADHLPGSR